MKKILILMLVLLLPIASAETFVSDELLSFGVGTEVDPFYYSNPNNYLNTTTLNVTDTNETTRVNELFANVSNWNTAFSWGNHAIQGYLKLINLTGYLTSANLTGYLTADNLSGYYNSADNETDPNYFNNPKHYFNSTDNFTITESMITDLSHTIDTNETTRVDELFNNVSNWNDAYSWGDHALAGYLTSVADVWVNESGDNMTGNLYIEAGNGRLVSTNAGGALDVMTSTGGAGYISFGNTADIGISSDGVVGSHNYNGAFIFKQKASNPVQDVEFIFIEETGDWRFALPSSGVDHGTYNPRSMIIAGASVNNESNVHCSYWGFSNLDCDTGTTGADLGVQDDLEVLGKIYSADWTDVSITESQISDLSHTIDTNETTRVDELFANVSKYLNHTIDTNETTRVDELFNNVSNWNDAYSWGDHSLSGYLTAETDPNYFNNPKHYFNSTDNFTITESMITDLSHTIDTNETTKMNEIYPLQTYLSNFSYSEYNISTASATFDKTSLEMYHSNDDANISGSTIIDLDGGDVNGTISGATTSVTGIINEAVDYDGTDVTTISSLSITSGSDKTFSFWVKPDSFGAGGNFLLDSSAGRYIFAIKDSLTEIGMYDGTSWKFSGDSAQVNVWNHIVFVINGTNLKTYLNGTEIQDVTITQKAIGGTTRLGNHNSNTNNGLQGIMDEVAVWSRALAPSEVTNLFNAGAGISYYATNTTTTYDTTKISGNVEVGDKLFVTNEVYATDYITASKVPIIDGTSALTQLDNIENWTKDGKIQYKEHYAKVKIKDYTKLKPIYEQECTSEWNLLNLTFSETCEDVLIGYDEEEVEKYGLSMETRVSELEKMVWELYQEVWKTK